MRLLSVSHCYFEKSEGIAEVLNLTKSFAERLPDLDSVASQGGNTLGGRLAKVLVQGLSSPKADIRSSSESLLDECVKNGVIGVKSVKKVASRQKPAIQRAIAPIVAKLAASGSATQAANQSGPVSQKRQNKPPILVHQELLGKVQVFAGRLKAVCKVYRDHPDATLLYQIRFSVTLDL
jgi:hypothetical protein